MGNALSGARGTAPSFERVYAAELRYVWNTLRRLGVPDRDLEDVAHDVFVVVHRKLADYDPARPLRPWLFGIAFRTASDFRRRAAHRREKLEDHGESAAPVSQEGSDPVEAREARNLVRAALERLEPDRRAVLILHDIDGVAVPAVAEALEIPLNTAYSRLRLARRDFTAALRRHEARRGA